MTVTCPLCGNTFEIPSEVYVEFLLEWGNDDWICVNCETNIRDNETA